MPKLFLSYRRQDSGANAGRLYDRLVASFGQDQVFMDTEQIPFGVNFMQNIDTQLRASEVCLVIIGPHWLVSEDGRRRLEEADDVVRHELEAALHRKLRIIPVMVGGGRMPRRSELPETLVPLCCFNALEVSDQRFHRDVEILLHAIIDPTSPPHDSTFAQLNALRCTLYLSKIALLVVPSVLLLVLAGAWVGLFDYLTLDTKLASYTMWLGDLVMETPRTDNVRLVTIDEETEHVLQKSFDRSWRSEHVRLIEALVTAGVKAIVFDLFFEEPSVFDNDFVRAIRQATQRGVQVMVGARGLIAGKPDMIPGLQTAISGWGTLCIGHTLGYARTVPLAIRSTLPNGEPTWPSLGLIAAFGAVDGLELNTALRQLLFHDASGRIRQLPFSTMEALNVSQNACPALSKGSHVANALIRLSPLSYWRNPKRRIPYQQFLLPEAELQKQLGGKIVLVGVTKMNTDLYGVRHGWQQEERYGVELHADVINNLFSGVYVQPLSITSQVLLMIGMAVLGALLALWRRPPAALRQALLSLGSLGYLGVSIFLYASSGVLLNVTYQLAAFYLSASMLGRVRKKLTTAVHSGVVRGNWTPSQLLSVRMLVLLTLCPLQMGFKPVLVDVVKSNASDLAAYRSVGDEELASLRIYRQGQAIEVQRNLSLESTDEIETDAAVIAVLQFPEGHEVFLLPRTRVVVGSLFVLFGDLLVHARGFFTVETTFMTAGVEGTEFFFHARPRGTQNTLVSVVVLDGVVRCSSKKRLWSPMRVGRAQQFTVRRGLFPATIPAPESTLRSLQWQLDQLRQFVPSFTRESSAH